MPINLTDKTIRHTLAPDKGRLELADATCRGLWLRITPNTRTFAFRFRDQTTGRSERLTLGPYPDLSLRDARAVADKLRQQITAGKNPSAHKREAPKRTFRILAERFLNEHARRHKRSADADERMLRLHILPHWVHRDYTKIERADVISLIEGIISSGKPILANRVQALISTIFSFGVDVDLVKANPCTRLRKRAQERIKTRVLTDDELRLFWHRVVAPPVSRSVGLALRLVLLTGCRPGEVAGMTRSELEFDLNGVPVSWLIPAARVKNGRAHFVPLSPLARNLVVEALHIARGDALMFPSPSSEQAIAGHALSVAMQRLTAALDGGVASASCRQDPPTPHDLRRTCATRLAAAGVPAEDVSAVLNHVRAGVTGRHYDHYQRGPEKRAALDRWADILNGILEPKISNVVALRG